MKKTLTFLVVATCLFIFSCENNDDPSASVSAFEVEVDAMYFVGVEDAWIIFHDKDGNVLDKGQLTNGASLTFSNLKTTDPKVGVTLFTVTTNSADKLFFSLESFLAVDINSQWIIKRRYDVLANCGGQQGIAEITVDDANLGSLWDTMLSGTYIDATPDFVQSENTTFRFHPVELYPGCDDFYLSLTDDAGLPHYKFLENLSPGQHTFSLSDFHEYDHLVDFNFPLSNSAILSIKAFDATESVYDKGYFIQLCFSDAVEGNSVSSFKGGYLSKFQKYQTFLSAGYPGHTVYYQKLGGIPSSPALPLTFNPIITNKDIDHYSFTANEDFVFRNAYFFYSPLVSSNESGIDWTIYSGKENDFKNLITLPQELLDTYPEFRKEKLTHQSSTFYTLFKTFDEEIAERFEEAVRSETYTYAYKTVY